MRSISSIHGSSAVLGANHSCIVFGMLAIILLTLCTELSSALRMRPGGSSSGSIGKLIGFTSTALTGTPAYWRNWSSVGSSPDAGSHGSMIGSMGATGTGAGSAAIS